MGEDNFVILGETMLRQERREAHVMLSHLGIIETWQLSMTSLFQWTADEAIGQSLAALIIPGHMQAAHLRGLRQWQEGGVAVVACKHFRTEGIRKDGSSLPVYVDVQIVDDDAGVRFLGWVAAAENEGC